MESVDCVVIGGGVVGLATARRLAQAGLEVIVAEAEKAVGTGISARNSEVIHAGIYYPKNSLKAALCVEGRELLYNYCKDRNIAAKAVGKFIVAANAAQDGELAAIRQRAFENGVKRLELWSARQVADVEPEIYCHSALFSPDTGIVDSHAFMVSLVGDLEAMGGWIALASPVDAIVVRENGFEVSVGGQEPMTIGARIVVNAAGLHSAAVGAMLGHGIASKFPKISYAKGNYFSLSGVAAPFRHLIYPVPVPGGLGTHATLDLQGAVRFGPDVEWIEQLDYRVDPARADSFYAAIRDYWPALPDGALVPAYSGIRPKIGGPGEAAKDFLIAAPTETGIPGYVHLSGIESPGLTASLAIAEHVAKGLGLTAFG
ncbi:MAG: NAD(P)/FAD-dependent oxidoreductase [Beijerinckiaceae bacterium]|nr:NAD(P)/FAD-dependent oxidoreductase [Beijerinckiaceae bacterium]